MLGEENDDYMVDEPDNEEEEQEEEDEDTFLENDPDLMRITNIEVIII